MATLLIVLLLLAGCLIWLSSLLTSATTLLVLLTGVLVLLTALVLLLCHLWFLFLRRGWRTVRTEADRVAFHVVVRRR